MKSRKDVTLRFNSLRLLDANGDPITDSSLLAGSIIRHFSELYNRPHSTSPTSTPAGHSLSQETAAGLMNNITKEEIIHNAQAKNGRQLSDNRRILVLIRQPIQSLLFKEGLLCKDLDKRVDRNALYHRLAVKDFLYGSECAM